MASDGHDEPPTPRPGPHRQRDPPIRRHWADRTRRATSSSRPSRHPGPCRSRSWAFRSVPRRPGRQRGRSLLEPEGTGGGAYALCTWTGKDPQRLRRRRSHRRTLRAAAFVVLDPAIPDQLPGYVAHEFNHVLQHAIDFREPVLTLWEGTANAATGGPGRAQPCGPVETFSATAGCRCSATATCPTGSEVWMEPEYGAEIWFHHLEEAHGAHRGDATVRLWWSLAQEGPPNRPHLLDAWEEIFGDWVGDLLSFATARGHVGGRPRRAGRGRLGPDEAVTPRVLELHGDTTRWSPATFLGTIYVDLVPTPGVSTTLEVRGEPGSRWDREPRHRRGSRRRSHHLGPLLSKARIAIVATQVDDLDLTAGDWYSLPAPDPTALRPAGATRPHRARGARSGLWLPARHALAAWAWAAGAATPSTSHRATGAEHAPVRPSGQRRHRGPPGRCRPAQAWHRRDVTASTSGLGSEATTWRPSCPPATPARTLRPPTPACWPR